MKRRLFEPRHQHVAAGHGRVNASGLWKRDRQSAFMPRRQDRHQFGFGKAAVEAVIIKTGDGGFAVGLNHRH